MCYQSYDIVGNFDNKKKAEKSSTQLYGCRQGFIETKNCGHMMYCKPNFYPNYSN